MHRSAERPEFLTTDAVRLTGVCPNRAEIPWVLPLAIVDPDGPAISVSARQSAGCLQNGINDLVWWYLRIPMMSAGHSD